MAQQQARRLKKVRVSAEELSVICQQIAMILRAGLPLYDGIDALSSNYRGTSLAYRFRLLRKSVLETGSLYRGLSSAGMFPDYMAEMVLIGERSGELDTVMENLYLHYQREACIRRSIHTAVAYPLIIIAIMTVLIAVLVTSVLPVFEDVFSGMGINALQNPWISAGVSAGRIILVVSCIFVFLSLLVLLLIRMNQDGRFRRFLFTFFPSFRYLEEQINAGRFASVLAMLFRDGFPLDESLRLIGRIVNPGSIADKIAACLYNVENHMPFQDAIEKMHLFKPLHIRMIQVGVQAGQTEAVMAKIAEIYENEADEKLAHFVSIIEPTLVAIMTVVIGAILLAVLLPLLSLMRAMA